METRLAVDHCPKCGHILDAATGATDDKAVPRGGDVTLCIKCGEILTFTKDLKVRFPTKKEKLKFTSNPVVIKAQIFIRGRRS